MQCLAPTMEAIVISSIAKRRRAAAMAAAITSCYAFLEISPRGTGIKRPLFSFAIFITGLRPSFFERMYRMRKKEFFDLAERIAIHDGPRPVRSCVLLRLSLTLRWLAGGSYIDLAQAHYQSVSSVFWHIENTLSSLDDILDIQFPFNDSEWLHRSSELFSRRGRSPIRGRCAALDGIAIRIAEPAKTDVPNPSTYFNRKGFFALNVQAACDAEYRFLSVAALTPESTHDSTGFAMSSLSELLTRQTGGLPQGFWIAGDEAYPCTDRLLSPWPGRNLTVEKDCFNYWQSSARIHIEQAFGILVARWGIFWRPLRVRVKKSAQIVSVCCKLHNYILDSGNVVNVPAPSEADNESSSDRPDGRVYLQDECDRDIDRHRRRRDLEQSGTRTLLTDRIKADGLHRPSVY